MSPVQGPAETTIGIVFSSMNIEGINLSMFELLLPSEKEALNIIQIIFKRKEFCLNKLFMNVILTLFISLNHCINSQFYMKVKKKWPACWAETCLYYLFI